jgi:hypothetical protein
MSAPSRTDAPCRKPSAPSGLADVVATRVTARYRHPVSARWVKVNWQRWCESLSRLILPHLLE